MKKKLFIATPVQGKDWHLKADSMKVEGGAVTFTNAEVKGNKYETLTLSLSAWSNIYGFGDEVGEAGQTPKD